MPRKKTGLKRPIQVPVFFDADEFEFTDRKCFDLNVTKASWMRDLILHTNWRMELGKLRQKQSHFPKEKFRRELKTLSFSR